MLLFLALLLCTPIGWRRRQRRPQNSLFQRCNRCTRSLVQRTLASTSGSNIQPTFTFARFERILMIPIPRSEQRCPGAPALQRRRNAESDALCRSTHVRVAAERSAERALAGPECHRARAQFGDALRRGCAEAQEVRAVELSVGGLREEREGGC